MRQDLQSLLIIAVAIVLAYIFLNLFKLKCKSTTFWLGSWYFLSCIAFLGDNFYFVLIALILVKVTILKNDVDKNMLFYLAVFPCLPSSQDVMLPVPGIHIFTGSYYHFLNVVILLPLIPRLLYKSRSMNRSIFMFIPLLYILSKDTFNQFTDTLNLMNTSNMTVLQNTLTNKIRGTLVLFITMVIPIYAFSAWVTSYSKLYLAFTAIFTTGLVLLFMTVPLALLNWDIYSQLESVGYVGTRGGFKRLSLSFDHAIQFGKFAYIFLIVLFSHFLGKKRGFLFGLIICLILTFPAIYLTGSRSAIIGVLIALISFVYFARQSQSRKLTLAFSFMLVLSVAVPFLASNAFDDVDLTSLDSTSVDGSGGTFEYRKRLLDAGLTLIPRNFWFGDLNYTSTVEMEALRQGQGIIDTLNSWLQMALKNGVPYMIMFLILVMSCIKACTNLVDIGYERRKTALVYYGAGLAAILTSLAITAFFDSFGNYLWIFIGITLGLRYTHKNKLRAKEKVFSIESEN